MSALSQTGAFWYCAFKSVGSMNSFIRRSRKMADSPSASASRPIELR